MFQLIELLCQGKKYYDSLFGEAEIVATAYTKGTSHFEHLSRGGGFKVVFLKISNPGFLQTSTFVTYFLILF